MTKRNATALCVAGLLMSSAGAANAGTLTTFNDVIASELAAALTSGGAGGITITGATLSANSSGNSASSGTFTTSGTNNFGLSGTGIVISNGNAAQDGTTGAFIDGVNTSYYVPATASQIALLDQVATAASWNDVTELDITFDAGPNTDHVFFNTVFTSAEYPVFVGEFVDGFGLFLNGTNIAYAGGDPVNIDSPLMLNTAYPTDGGNDGTAYQTTPEGGVLVLDGSAVLTYGGAVTPGSTGNTLTFIIADANDSALDTTAFIQGLGNATPPTTGGVPEPLTLSLFGAGLAGLAASGLKRRRKTKTA